MRRGAAVVAAGAVCVGLVSGCGHDYPSYSHPQACSVPAETITKVLGTDHFRTRAKGRELPLTTQAYYDCTVATSDKHQAVVSITAMKLSPDDQASRRKQIAAADEQLTVGQTSVGITPSDGSFDAYLLCGPVAASVQASPDRTVTKAERTALVTAVAEAAGCG